MIRSRPLQVLSFALVFLVGCAGGMKGVRPPGQETTPATASTGAATAHDTTAAATTAADTAGHALAAPSATEPTTPAPTAAGAGMGPAVSADGVTFTFRGDAKSVALVGDFNNWSASSDPLTRRADGAWTVTKKLPAGTYGYKFVVDGVLWKQDAANPDSRDDGFGGKNSLVVVK